MAERSFSREVESLKLGKGETFSGEGILAVTKALLQSGVSYVGGYQGAPVSHLLDVLVDATDILSELGVHLETCSNEASAAGLLAASINYPVRGAVCWKSIVGTNVASDALSYIASTGVMGGALMIIGEDFGEGASVTQERTLAIALKSGMWMLDPRPDLPNIVRAVEEGFLLSEQSNTPVMVELRIRACHVTGTFEAKDNREGAISVSRKAEGPPEFVYDRLGHPPATFRQEKLKIEVRRPAAEKFILERGLNELIPGDKSDIGIIVQGGLYSGLYRALEHNNLIDADGEPTLPILVLNVIHPLSPDQIAEFCAGKRAVLIVEEGSPEFLEHEINTILHRRDLNTTVVGKGTLPEAGDYSAEVLTRGIDTFLQNHAPGRRSGAAGARLAAIAESRKVGAELLGEVLPPRPPAFCTGCPERPVFAAIKLAQRETGPVHIAADIGCHAFATFQPFSLGNSIIGYGMSVASAAAVGPLSEKRTISIMGDGGFWHNGLVTGVESNLFNRGDGVLVIMQNGYTSATGIQYMPSSKNNRLGGEGRADIEKTLKSLGVGWIKKIRSYSVAKMRDTLKDALTTTKEGLKVIIADGECQLARQRRLRGENAEKLEKGERVVTTRFGVDDAICTGDRSCIRLSGCPSLTVKPSPDPLRTDPVVTVVESCVGCGLCGEVSHAAVLCPSFYRVETIQNANRFEQALFNLRQRFIRFMQGRRIEPGAEPVPAAASESLN